MNDFVSNFLITNGIDTNNLPTKFQQKLYSEQDAQKNDMDYTLTYGNLNYRNEGVEKISIKDIVGSLSNYDNASILEFFSQLYNDKDTYGSRSLEYLNKGIASNITNILNSNELIKTIKIGDKYYIGTDGNHRSFYLLMVYLIELEKNKNNPEALQMLEEKFQINVVVRKKSDYEIINKICYCMSKKWNDDIKIEFVSDAEYIGVVYLNGQQIRIKTEEEFLNIFNNYLNSLDKSSKKYNDLISILEVEGYFEDTHKNDSSNTIDNEQDSSAYAISIVVNDLVQEQKNDNQNGNNNLNQTFHHPQSDVLNEFERQKQIAKYNGDDVLVAYYQSNIKNILEQGQVQVSSEEWDRMDYDQKRQFMMLKMREAKILDDRDSFEYWSANIVALDEKEQTNEIRQESYK